MKTFLYIIGIGLFCVVVASSVCGSSGVPTEYFIYVSGDTGRTVQISYFAQKNSGSDKHVTFTEQVQLPFFKQVDYLHGGWRDEEVFLEITSENDSTTKAIIFGHSLLLADTICPAFYVFEKEYANYSEKCSYCMSLPKDSVLNYFKAVHYPCYLEFAKGETVKKVWLRDTFRWQPYE